MSNGITARFGSETVGPREWELQRHMRVRAASAARAKVLCPMPGHVTELYVGEGEQVRKGRSGCRSRP